MAKDMKYNYDKESDSLLIHVKEGEEESFEEIIPGINIELNKKGEIIGLRFSKLLDLWNK